MPTPAQAQLSEITSELLKLAVEYLKDDEEICPTIISFDPKGHRMIGDVQDVFTEDAERHKDRILRSLLQRINSQVYAIMTEAWAVNRENQDDAFSVTPSKAADRREVLLIHGEHKSGDVVMVTYTIIREGNHRRLKPEADAVYIGKNTEDHRVLGSMTGLLK